ncbi:AEC family transporter [Propionivibrio sp.]|uniref:AEC family transporter n=1 Tax=Propionivibrio sp. TaxID=2212460 RepID=UPI00272EDD28|nr:AEC family transporter [Propionivibrio sp.]
MDVFLQQLVLALPLFSLVLIGYLTMRLSGWPSSVSDGLTRFVFTLALPAMLFRLMSKSRDLPPVDSRLLIAFFGGCLIVFVIGRLVSWKIFKLDGVSQSVFALGGVFSNNVMLGLPLAKVSLGEAAVPSVALVLVFNALILWTLVTVSVEWARHGSFSAKGFARTARGVLTNPIVVGILGGTLVSLSGRDLPEAISSPINMIGQSGSTMALVALGMGLAEYGIRDGLRVSFAVCAIKLIVLPLIVWGLAWLLGLPKMETQVVVLLSSMATGANVYLMSRQFKALEGPTASALVLSTLLASVTTPLVLALMN